MMIEETPGTYVGQQLERGLRPQEVFEKVDDAWRYTLRLAKATGLESSLNDHLDFWADARNIVIRAGLA